MRPYQNDHLSRTICVQKISCNSHETHNKRGLGPNGIRKIDLPQNYRSTSGRKLKAQDDTNNRLMETPSSHADLVMLNGVKD